MSPNSLKEHVYSRLLHFCCAASILEQSYTLKIYVHVHVNWLREEFQCRCVLLIWIIVGQAPTALAVGAGGGCLDIFTLVYHFSPFSPSLWETARYRLKYCLKGPLNPKQPTNQIREESYRRPKHVICLGIIRNEDCANTARTCTLQLFVQFIVTENNYQKN